MHDGIGFKFFYESKFNDKNTLYKNVFKLSIGVGTSKRDLGLGPKDYKSS